MKCTFRSQMFAVTVVATIIAGCSGKNDPISQAEKGEQNKPGIAEIKAIAEEGFHFQVTTRPTIIVLRSGTSRFAGSGWASGFGRPSPMVMKAIRGREGWASGGRGGRSGPYPLATISSGL